MSFSSINSGYLVRTIDTSEILRMGSATVLTSGNLGHIRIGLFIFNQAARSGSEQVRVKVYSDSGYSSLLYTSSWVSLNVTTIPLLNSTHSWIGMIRADFSKQPLNNQLVKYIAIELQNYTYVLGTFWIGAFKDYPYPTYSAATYSNSSCYKFEIFTYVPRAIGA